MNYKWEEVKIADQEFWKITFMSDAGWSWMGYYSTDMVAPCIEGRVYDQHYRLVEELDIWAIRAPSPTLMREFSMDELMVEKRIPAREAWESGHIFVDSSPGTKALLVPVSKFIKRDTVILEAVKRYFSQLEYVD